MKLISWNVNGIRAAVRHGFKEIFIKLNADIFCLNETKVVAGQIDLSFPGYYSYWNYAERKGYSGTAVFTKIKPLSVKNGIGIAQFDTEGRVITLEFSNFYLVCCYTPNSKLNFERLDYRLKWDETFRKYLVKLKKQKSVILCGDLNVAHENIDLKNPTSNHKHAGFSDEERQDMSKLLTSGFIDSYRYFYPQRTGAYSWWNYRFNSRARNVGWRIDYFIVSCDLKDKMQDAKILSDILGSDHCPVELDIDLKGE